ncbi:MAG TPA: putative molybdenum carrier protein [Lacipirellulaceae bacterium]|nr:putative molybdenum carrier protein [Lacipirellulaceae bacterium]
MTLAIVSGGQTGADRAALDFALRAGLPHDGWCPRGRLAEDGPLAGCYALRETPSPQYAERTAWNVRDSDATVVLTTRRELTGGTALTAETARSMQRPLLHLCAADCGPLEAAVRLRQFLAEHRVGRLNVAGPRASQDPAVYAFVDAVLTAALASAAVKTG